LQAASSARKVSFFASTFSTIASMTMSQSDRASRLVVVERRARAASRSAPGSFPFSTALASEPSMRARPFFARSSVTSRTSVR
jgi:hypothetical protein